MRKCRILEDPFHAGEDEREWERRRRAKSEDDGGKNSLGDAKSSLGDAKSSLGDAKSSVGDAKKLGG